MVGLLGALTTWLGAIAWPLISRVLVSIGIGTITYTGVNLALTTVLDKVNLAKDSITGPLAELLALAGFFDAITIVCGGLVAGLSMMVMQKMAFTKGLSS